MKVIAKLVKTVFYEYIISRPILIQKDISIISFTFDDVPMSVLENAIPILEKNNICSTLYVSPGLQGYDSPYFGDKEIEHVASHGHEIGCHTYSHYALHKGNSRDLYFDALKGKQALENIVGTGNVNNFSYPFGEISYLAKEKLQSLFSSMRTSTGGINKGRVDLNYLRAEHLYFNRQDMERIKRMISEVTEIGGWLIFYTHGVLHQPKAYDSSIVQFSEVVDEALNSGSLIEPVHKALQIIHSKAGAIT